MDPVFEAIRTVLAIREFSDRPVPDDVLRDIIEAGRLTASAQNKQPWHFVLVTDRAALDELGRLVRTGPYVAQASAAVVVAYEKANRLAVSDVSRAIQSMILAAWSRGVGSNWTGWAGMDEVREFAGLPPEYDVLAVIPLGYPVRAVGKGIKKRKPLGEVASLGRFGRPLEPGGA